MRGGGEIVHKDSLFFESSFCFFLKFFRFAVEVEDKGMEPELTFNDEEIVETEQNATKEVKYHNHILSINNKTLRQFWK